MTSIIPYSKLRHVMRFPSRSTNKRKSTNFTNLPLNQRLPDAVLACFGSSRPVSSRLFATTTATATADIATVHTVLCGPGLYCPLLHGRRTVMVMNDERVVG